MFDPYTGLLQKLGTTGITQSLLAGFKWLQWSDRLPTTEKWSLCLFISGTSDSLGDFLNHTVGRAVF